MTRANKTFSKKLIEKYATGKYEIWSTDECHFHQHGTRFRMWLPKDIKDPTVIQEPNRLKVSIFGSVNVDTGRLVYCMNSIFNAETFLEHLKKILQGRSKRRKILLIVDNARYHHAKVIQPWLERNKRKIEFMFLPPYSPELNPIERVWKKTRYLATHNRYFPTLESLSSEISQRLNIWDLPNEELTSLCSINYVA